MHHKLSVLESRVRATAQVLNASIAPKFYQGLVLDVEHISDSRRYTCYFIYSDVSKVSVSRKYSNNLTDSYQTNTQNNCKVKKFHQI